MYAIIKTGGKQYKVSEGDLVRVEKLNAEVGESVSFEDVLLVKSDSDLKVGTPKVENAKVEATVKDQAKDKKVVVFKYRPKKASKSKKGHRQPYFLLMIDVTLLKKKKKRLGFAIKGHANFDQHGYDIVCAAVSILSYTAVNTLDYYKIGFDFSDDGKIMKVLLNKSEDKSEIILNDFEIGIKTLLTNYNEYVNLNYREV